MSLDESLVRNLYGDTFSYFGAARRIIAKHFSNSVKDLKTLKDLLRYNGFKKANNWNDPSFNSPNKAYSARVDLKSRFGWPNGGIDTKVVNSDLMSKMASVAISGPTIENNKNLPVFKFSWEPFQRKGVPVEFNFPYIYMAPQTIKDDSINDIYNFK